MKNPYVLFLVGLLSLSNIAFAYDFSSMNNEGALIYYNIIGSNEVEVTNNRGSYSSTRPYSGNLNVPTSVVYSDITYTITSIGAGAFSECVNLLSVNLPNTVNLIRANAFMVVTT